MTTPFRDSIIALDVNTGKVEEFATLATGIASHTSALFDDYLFIYGGTNGLKIFDAVMRYSIKDKQWTIMTKYPES